MENSWKRYIEILRPYIEILRPVTCVLGMSIVFIGALLAIGSENFGAFLSIPTNIFKLLAGMVVYFFVVGSGNTINDVVDIEIDKINRPNRTIVRGAFTEKQVVIYYIYQILGILFLASLGASLSPNPSLIPAMVAFFLMISFTYSLKIKSTGLLANLIVAFSASIAFPFGAFFVLDFKTVMVLPQIWLLYATAFFFLLGREIGKDLEDIEGDRQFGVKSIAIKWGITTARVFIMGTTLGVCVIFVLAMIWYDFNALLIIFGSISIILLFIGNWAFWKDIKEKKWRILASRVFLVAQLFTIISHLLAALT
ncbi:MAG: UbiA family prenyltransferase [Promethearchaeota archaeon]